jgi:hypothetical protein
MKHSVTNTRRSHAVWPLAAAVKTWILLGAFVAAAGTAPALAASVPAKGRADRARTLDSINIEGKIAVPQVLFITARDVRRFRDGLGASYQKGAGDVVGSVSGPTRLRVTTGKDVLKEEAP